MSTAYRDRFLSTKKFLSNLSHIDTKFLEINDIKWVSSDTIKYSIENKKTFIKLRSAFEQSLLYNMDDLLRIIE